MISRKVLTVSRSGDDLQVNDEVSYFLVEGGFDPGPVSMRRTMVSGPWTESQYQVGVVRDISEGRLTVAVKGDDQEDMNDKLQELIEAMTQFAFTIQLTVGSAEYAWSCYCAEYAVPIADNPFFDDPDFPIAVASFSWPRHPKPILGPF